MYRPSRLKHCFSEGLSAQHRAIKLKREEFRTIVFHGPTRGNHGFGTGSHHFGGKVCSQGRRV